MTAKCNTRVLHIVEAFGGGVFSFLADLVNETADDFEIYIAYGVRSQTPENFRKFFSDKVHFICVESFGREISLKNDFKAYFELKRIIKDVNPQVVHLHSSKAGFLGRFAANCKKRRVIYNPHGFSFLMEDCSALKRKAYRIIEKAATINRAVTVGCSKGEYQEAKKLNKRAVWINNGVNISKLDKICPEVTPIQETSFKVCTLARIGYQKQPGVFNKIAEKLPETEFTWIGDGELRTELSSPNIKITGWLKKDDAVDLMTKHSVFMLTSAWEGLPISLLEAMYMGRICVVSNCIGNRDVIKNGVNGFVCNNADEFTATLKKIAVMDKNELEKISSAAWRDVLYNYNISKNVKEKYVKLYEGNPV